MDAETVDESVSVSRHYPAIIAMVFEVTLKVAFPRIRVTLLLSLHVAVKIMSYPWWDSGNAGRNSINSI